MLETLDLKKKLDRDDYADRMPSLQERLLQLQRACWEAKIASVVVFSGWDAAGKGSTIQKLTQKLEPRGFRLHAIHEPRTYETYLPWMWRFWVRLPNYGEMAIFDNSWYARVLADRVEDKVKEIEWRAAFEDINGFERGLADDRYLMFKFFLHISKKEQNKRFKKMASDPATSWQVGETDWAHHKQYDEFAVATEKMLARTESEWAPWTLVEATDRRWTRVKVFETLIEGLEKGLQSRDFPLPEPRVAPQEDEDDDSYD
jgi:polyphosphate kinase 2 (PPK2 family)